MGREISEKGLHLVIAFEGFSPKAYKCPAGVWTIGYGHTGGVVEGATINSKEALQVLRNDMKVAEGYVSRLVKVPLNDNQFDALVSWTFNLGPGALSASTLLKRLNTGDYASVPNEMVRWANIQDPKTGQMTPLPGLLRRRRAEAALWNLPADAPTTAGNVVATPHPDDEDHLYGA